MNSNTEKKNILTAFRKWLPVAFLLLWDALSAVCAVALGIKLTFWMYVKVPNYYQYNMGRYIVGVLAVVVICNLLCGCYNRLLRSISFTDIMQQCASVILQMGALFLIDVVVRYVYISRNGERFDEGLLPFPTYIIMAMFLVILSVLGRGIGRMFIAAKTKISNSKVTKAPIIIYGAGEAGTYFLKKVTSHPEMNLRVVAYIDDDISLKGKKIGGVPIVGGIDKLAETISANNVNQVIVAIPTATKLLMQNVMGICKEKNCAVRRFGTIDDAEVSDMKVSEINLEDLLRRGSVNLNMNIVKQFIEGETVLVTGGCGSIGSEICRQVLRFGCGKLIIFDIHENGLFFIDNELKQKYAGKYELRLGSIRDRKRLSEVFKEFSPKVVFHAAAHKHVPMMEINPREAIKNNVMGTINVCQEAILHDVKKFICISTDKAVNPTNIMGASKRITELVMQMMDKMSDTDFAAVRFGNVLGSNGSVVPFFREQIRNGGPVTVTHPEMRRYFMTIPEAAQLVLEAGAMAKGGEIFVLDMGEPVLISDLAKDLIRLSGYEPDKDIKIIYTGLRPGEKLFEEISLADEDVDRTSNKKITIMKPMEFDATHLACEIKDIEEAVRAEDDELMFAKVKELVPTFNHNKNV